MSDALSEWVEHLARYSEGHPGVEGNTVFLTLDPTRLGKEVRRFVVGPAPADAVLMLEGPKGLARFELAVEHPPPRELTFRVDPALETLVMTSPEGHLLPSVELILSRNDPALTLSGLPARQVIVRGGVLECRQGAEHVLAENTVLNVSWSLETLEIRGSLGLRGGPLHAGRVFLDEAVITEGGELHFHELLPRAAGDSPRLVVRRASVYVRWAAAGATFVGEGGDLHFGERGGRPLRSVSISGTAPVETQGALQETSFEVSQPPVQLNVEGQLLEASGSVALRAARRAVVTGAGQGALALHAVLGVDGAELENVDIYSLGIGDLTYLREAERVYPWVPRPGKARRLEDAMFPEQREGLSRTQRMHFWASMADILKQKGAPGRVQSEVRYAAQRARRKALPRFGRERSLLTAYGLLGYGERILRPLGWYAALGLGLAVWFTSLSPQLVLSWDAVADTWSTVWPMWWRVAKAPLAFFRLATGPFPDSMAQQATLLGFRVIGLLLLLLSLLAIRRLVRLE